MEIAEIAREKLGFEDLRPGQREAIEAILDGYDTLVVQPTGSGKSAIYQIAGIMLEGSTVIISPLIALQKDQVDSLQEKTEAEALALNSKQRAGEMREGLEAVGEGKVEYIFLAPEQLHKPETMEALSRAGISLFVVDEAHCISQWGHEFRPDYLGLARMIESLGHPRVLAMTATASREVRDEIVTRLGMRRARVFVRAFNRPNIFLRVDHFATEEVKRDALTRRILYADKPGIVYTSTRKAGTELVDSLTLEGVTALLYHGGLGGEERDLVQERFMAGEADVVVATNAFGMGVDKPDIRFVYHHAPAESPESYYQEIGRAGRDGKRSEAVLFYRSQDIGSQAYKTGGGAIDADQLEDLANHLADRAEPVDPEQVVDESGLSRRKLALAIQRLEDSGAVETLPDGSIEAVENADMHEAALRAAEEQERRGEEKRQRLREMREYAETTACRREFLLQSLGDEFRGPCGFCDNCEAMTGRTAAVEGERREVK